MDNVAVARALEELADLEELSGADAFRLRAFRNAARAIEGLAESVADLARAKKLEQVRGVGAGVAKRIQELLDTGKIAETSELRAKLPPGLVELMNLPGVGLKTAQQVWRERGITTIDALEAAARDGKLRDLVRFSVAREEKLLAAIAAYRKRAAAPKRRLMAEALVAAEAICERMRAVPGVLACDYAGSLRRRAETIGDLDVLVAAEPGDATAIMDAFVAMPEVVEVLGKGDTRSSVVLDGGMQTDLRVVPRDAWGAALQYFTGSKDHNVAMRTIAVKKKLKVSEYGVFDASGAKLAGEDEASVYEAIGLRWIPPELRENRGEIEAATLGAGAGLPDLVALDDVRGDLHMHTTETDGKSSLDQMVAAARDAGRAYVAITDHSESLTFVRGMGRERLREQRAKIRAVEEKMGGAIRVFAGLEADILADGSIDVADATDELEWVIGSVHTHLGMPRDAMTKRVVSAIESGKIDCLGHPTGRQIGSREPSALDLEAVVAALARCGVAIELNSSPMRLDVDEHLARMARDAGVPIVMNSDAHSIRELSHLRFGIGIARRAWLGKGHLLNTRTAAELAEWRATRLSA
jgi:DNA polymerase (family 10)